MIFALFAAPAAVAASPSITVPVVGSGPGGAKFEGTFTIERFVSTGASVVAVGLVKGIVSDAAGPTGSIVKNVAWPVQTGPAAAGVVIQQQVCEILNLVLGPLHLDLLGLVIDLNQVVLNITAVAGAGNLLGNLLCAITGLLDGISAGALGELARLLNQLLGLLG